MYSIQDCQVVNGNIYHAYAGSLGIALSDDARIAKIIMWLDLMVKYPDLFDVPVFILKNNQPHYGKEVGQEVVIGGLCIPMSPSDATHLGLKEYTFHATIGGEEGHLVSLHDIDF